MSPIRPPMPRSALTPQDCLKVATDAWEDLLASFKGQTEYIPGHPGDPLSRYIPAPNFWQIGCVFDTMLDYVWLRNDLGTPMSTDDLKPLMTLARNGYEFGIGRNAAVWYDDWAWYGIAASKAFDPAYMDFFAGDQLDFFQNVALNMWGLIAHGKFDAVADSIPAESDAWRTTGDLKDQLTQDGLKERGQYHHGTTHTWDSLKKLQDQDSFFNTPGKNWAVPRFDGGAWQYDMYATQLPLTAVDGNAYLTPNPADLGPPYQGPFQFSLMTGLYVVLAQRLAQAARIKDQLAADGRMSPDVCARLGSESYDDAIAASFRFIDDWSAVDQGDYSWVRKTEPHTPPGILFRERAPTYAKPPSIPDDRGIYVDGYPVVPGFKTDNFWCGDQGLYLGALVAHGRVAQATLLVNGVRQWLTCPCRRNVVIGFTPSSFPDHGDYASGSGIFWRYVLYACRTNANFRSWMINEEMGRDLLDNIVVASVSNTWTDANDLFKPFNKVAVGVAACYLLNEAAKAAKQSEARG